MFERFECWRPSCGATMEPDKVTVNGREIPAQRCPECRALRTTDGNRFDEPAGFVRIPFGGDRG